VAANAKRRMVPIPRRAFAVICGAHKSLRGPVKGEFYGGRLDARAGFIRGSRARSPAARPIIAWHPPPDGRHIRGIKPFWKPAIGVGMRWSDAYVVTDYGIAYWSGKSIRERALALIDVAHPNCRGSVAVGQDAWV